MDEHDVLAERFEAHRARLLRKLGTRNRVETLAIADGWGLVNRAGAVPAAGRA